MQKFRDMFNETKINLIESGNSATDIKWRRDGSAKIGEFSVTSLKTKEVSDFYIVINTKKDYRGTKLKNIELLEFKFYDSEGNIELVNNMEFVLGVGPTIKREFEKLISKNPEAIIFSADKKEKSRVKHYDKFAAKISSDYNYEIFYKTAITSPDDEYILVRQDKVQDFKNNFKTTKM